MLMRTRVQFLAARSIWYVLSRWEYAAPKRGNRQGEWLLYAILYP